MIPTDYPTITASRDVTVKNQVRLEADEFNSQSIKFREGTDWSCIYFNQFLTSDDLLSLPDNNLPETEQQYIKYDINIKVLTPIAGNIVGDMSGTATVIEFKPNKFDVFVVDLLGGVRAIFKVDTVTKKNMFLKSIYEIEYSILTLVDSMPSVEHMLEARTIQSFTKNKNHTFNVTRPLLKTNEIITYESLDNMFNMIRRDYDKSFYSKRDMLLFKYHDKIYFDPLINTLYYLIIGGKCNQFNNSVKILDRTIMQIFVNRNTILLDMIITPKYKSYSYRYNSIYMARLGNNLTLDVDYIMDEDGDTIVPNTTTSLPIGDIYLTNDLSGVNLTNIESQLRNYINNDEVQNEIILEIAKDYFSYEKHEKYNYGVLIMMLIKYSLTKE